MPAASAAEDVSEGLNAIKKLKSADPPLYLSPSEELSNAARLASAYLFSSLKPFAPKCPISELLADGFDAEQIWQQIDLQSRPLISSIRRKIGNFEKNPQEIRDLFSLGKNKENYGNLSNGNGKGEEFRVEGEEEMEELEEGEEEEEEEGGEGDENEGGDMEEGGGGGGVEDNFLKLNEMQEYLEDDEAREYGLKRKKKEGKKAGGGNTRNGSDFDDDDEEEVENVEEDDDADDDGEEEDELGALGMDDGSGEELENARYDDFFGSKGKAGQKRKSKPVQGSHDFETDGKSIDHDSNQKKQKVSTHEKELEKIRSTIEEMEKANLEPKTWTMQGEVTAAKRPKNSALEVDLDFEHNMRPAPVITEEVTASLEELIQKRIIEGRFDDVQKPPTLPSRAPREVKELDENKSKKGLAEIYEEEFVQKSGLISNALSLSDQQKKEAAMLFKALCLKLDALSHFHFTPKPVIEDMAIQANVPALAMEEIAPSAVSDAAMLAPEEVYAGKGDVKEEKELTQAERKRRRAKKKRLYKAAEAKRMLKKAQLQQGSSTNGVDDGDRKQSLV